MSTGLSDYADADARRFAQLAADPLKFIKLCWPDAKLYDKQRDILMSLADNKHTTVHAANAMGKTWVTATAALWFFLSRSPCRVVATSSSEDQLRRILWGEILARISTSRIKFPLIVSDLLIRKPGKDGKPLSLEYFMGSVANSVESFQGHHLPHDKARTLCLFEEASGVGDLYMEAAESWAHRTLTIGNPLNTTNFFYRNCKKGDETDPSGVNKLLRKVIHIDGLHSPNVQIGMRYKAEGRKERPPILIPGLLAYEEYLQREKEWDEVKRKTRLHGEFYEGDKSLLYPMAWLDRGKEKYLRMRRDSTPRTPKAIGIDVAMGGRDDSVWTVADELGVIEMIVKDTPDTMQIPGITIKLMEKYGIPANCVMMDSGGGGKQIADRLFELGYEITLVAFGGSAGEGLDDEESVKAKKSFKNRRVEMYWHLRSLLDFNYNEGSFALPDGVEGELLIQELNIMPLEYDSEGKATLPSKQRRVSTTSRAGGPTIEELLGRSPDRADSLVLATWGLKTEAKQNWKIDPDRFMSAGKDAKSMSDMIQDRVSSFLAKLR